MIASRTLLLFCLIASRALATDWLPLASALRHSDPSVRASAAAELRSLPDLDEQVRASLVTEDRYLALEVVSALGLQQLLPDLLTASLTDEDGALYLTIGSLLTQGNRARIGDLYRARLLGEDDVPLSPVARVIVIDTLGRLGVEIAARQARRLLHDRSYSVRLAAVYYLRSLLLRHRRFEYLPLLVEATSLAPFQLRLQALSIVTELPEFLKALAVTSLVDCERDRYSSIRAVCKRLKGRTGASTSDAATEGDGGGTPASLLELARENAAPSAPDTQSCHDTYAALFASPSLLVQIAFGYKDARPARFVGDRYERIALEGKLTAECAAVMRACGFAPDPDDGDLFLKEMPGPDGRDRTVYLYLTHSSVGPDDDENRSDPYQALQSERAEQTFHWGLSYADVIFYDGHSRGGGGIDFAPPHLTEQKEVDFGWYQKNHPGLTRLLQTLEKPSRASLFGLFSCSSSEHFAEEVLRRKPDLGIISHSRVLYYVDALRDMQGALAAVLGGWCREDFASAIHAESTGGSSMLRNFLRPESR